MSVAGSQLLHACANTRGHAHLKATLQHLSCFPSRGWQLFLMPGCSPGAVVAALNASCKHLTHPLSSTQSS